MANLILNRLVRSDLGAGLMKLLELATERRSHLLQILTYHRVLDVDGFDEQMAYLAANYHVISMADLIDVCQTGRQLRRNSLMITFDDAYVDIGDHAWPIMKRYDLPATVFVPTAFPDNENRVFWWDRLQYAFEQTPRRDVLETPAGPVSLKTTEQRDHAYRKVRNYVKRLPYAELLSWTDEICRGLEAPPAPHCVLGWQALRQLADEGVTLGAHTRSHRFLDELSPAEVENEVAGSLHDIEREIGDVLPVFAYPDGRYSDEVVKILESVGLMLAFTTGPGGNRVHRCDKLRLRRTNIGPAASVADLRARLLKAKLPVRDGLH